MKNFKLSTMFGLMTLALSACFTLSVLSTDNNALMFSTFALALSVTFFIIAYKVENDSYESMKMMKKMWAKEAWAKRMEEKGQ